MMMFRDARPQVQTILSKFGIVGLQREGYDANAIIYQHDFLFKQRVCASSDRALDAVGSLILLSLYLQHQIEVIPQWVSNNISSTVVRYAI